MNRVYKILTMVSLMMPFYSIAGAAAQIGELPIPPVMPYNSYNVSIATTILLILAGLAVISSIRDSYKFKSMLPFALALSGAAVVIPEVFVDILGCIYWPWEPGKVAFSIMGRHMTWFTVAVWFAYGSIVAYGSYAFLLRNSSTKKIWCWLGFAGILNILFEEIMLNIPGLYVYYGNQPLILLTKMPWWWLAVNVSGMFISAALTFRLKEYLKGWRAMLAILITPTVYLGSFSFAGMPAAIVVNGQFPWVIMQLGGIITVCFSFVAVLLAIKLLLNKNPN